MFSIHFQKHEKYCVFISIPKRFSLRFQKNARSCLQTKPSLAWVYIVIDWVSDTNIHLWLTVLEIENSCIKVLRSHCLLVHRLQFSCCVFSYQKGQDSSLWFLQQGMCLCAKSFQSYPTLCDPMDCSLPGSSVHGILQARVLECVAVPSSRGSSLPRDQTSISYASPAFAGEFFMTGLTWEAQCISFTKVPLP